MKIVKNNSRIILSLLFLALMGVSSCKKDKKEDAVPETPASSTGMFMMHLHTYIEDTEVDAYNITYTTTAGRNISLSMAQMYISDIQLVKLDGSTYNISGKKLLKVFETETYVVAEVPAGNYKSIHFKVGLDPATNLLNPTTSADSSILNRPAMWFNANAQPDGYVFMNVQGKIDTTSDASGTVAQMQNFTYKIGTNANYKQVNMPDKNFTILPDQVEYGHILIDYSKLFNGITLNQAANLSVTSAAANSTAPATIIANNIPAMFIYEQ
jgi:hypothetical protein